MHVLRIEICCCIAPYHCDFQLALGEEMWRALIRMAKEATVQCHGTTLTMTPDSVPSHVNGARRLQRVQSGIAGHAMGCVAAASHSSATKARHTADTKQQSHPISIQTRQGVLFSQSLMICMCTHAKVIKIDRSVSWMNAWATIIQVKHVTEIAFSIYTLLIIKTPFYDHVHTLMTPCGGHPLKIFILGGQRKSPFGCVQIFHTL